ncbi:hypothetical protein [Aneurinibacillus migulanus]|uniref:hypothetical protein n=1 Tax=Aneurinibacillus migulanus TaxID=47500 RepID=UPI000AD6D932|nr:hypothetical protein [Aneurinibacillus migulanus]
MFNQAVTSLLYTSDLINRQIFVVRGKKRRRGGGRETNRRPFGARCGGYPLWIVLDNQHP